MSNNEITSVKGDPAHPANLGHLCTKGWRSTRPIGVLPRALSRKSTGERVTWDRALDHAAEKFEEIIEAARSGRGRVLHLRPAPDRGLLRLQQAGEGPDRHQQRRHQLAPVHGLGGGGLQADARRRRAACLLRGHRRGGVRLHRRLQHRLGPPGAVPPASRAREAQAHCGGRPAPHRDRARRRRCTCRSRPAPTSRSSTACCTSCAGRVVRRRIHPPPHGEFRFAGRSFASTGAAADLRRARRRHRRGGEGLRRCRSPRCRSIARA